MQRSGTISELQIHPFFRHRNAAHQPSAIFPDQQSVAGIVTETVLCVIKSRLNTEGHPFLKHCIVTQSEPWGLVAFHAFAMTRPMVDQMSHAVFYLILMHLVRKIGARAAVNSFFNHDLNSVCNYLPHFVAPLVGRQYLKITITLASVTADHHDARNLERVTFLYPFVKELVGMRIRSSRAGSYP